MEANSKQIGGDHYKTAIDPWDAIEAWGLGYFDGNAVKYLSRWRKKGGIQDLEKAAHYIQKLIEIESGTLKQRLIDKLEADKDERLRRTHDQVKANFEAHSKFKIEKPPHPSTHGSFAFDTGSTALSGFPKTQRPEGYGQPRTLRDIL